MDSELGDTIVQPRVGGNYSVELEAVDAAGKVATVLAWSFVVVDAQTFTTTNGWDPRAEAIRAGTKGTYFVGESSSTYGNASPPLYGAMGERATTWVLGCAMGERATTVCAHKGRKLI